MALEGLLRGRFTALVSVLVVLLVTTPLVEAVGGPTWVALDLLFTAMMLALLYAMNRERYFLLLAVVLALPALAARWGLRLTDSPGLVILGFGAQIAFLAVSMGVVLAEILRSRRVTGDTIFGGISVYLLIGITFAMVYGLIDFLDPAAFAFQIASHGGEVRLPGSRGFAEIVYFSFSTMTTLGYGDLVPVAREARSMAILEVVTGQIFLAVFIARLVGLHMAHSRPGDFDA